MPRLHRVDVTTPGITRVKRGRAMSYLWPNGQRVVDADTKSRILALAIPPAWVDVWICPSEGGHIQAMGTDAAGRRQYLYHDTWRKRRDREKFVRGLAFGRALPSLRKEVSADLAAKGFPRARILAAGVRLLDIGGFRVGGEEYAEAHETFGVATLLGQHVKVHGEELWFGYPAKGGIHRSVVVHDADVAKVVKSLRRTRGPAEDLLAWKEAGIWRDVRAADLNDYIKGVLGDQFSAKDFRTWSATVYAAVVLAGLADPDASARQRRLAIARAVKDVAQFMGNTPAVCRSSYIDPKVIDKFEAGETIAGRFSAVAEAEERPQLRRHMETAVLELLEGGLATAA